MMVSSMEEKPRLRADIQMRPWHHDGQQGLLLQDPLRENGALFLSDGALLVLQHLDGNKTIRDIQVALSRQLGQIVLSADIEQFIRVLSENLFLEDQRFREFLNQQVRQYREMPCRPSLLAGNGYPEQSEALRRYLDDLFRAAPQEQNTKTSVQPRGVVAPHIDLERGKTTYAHIYGLLRKVPPADLYLVLGVNHHFYTDNPFIFTSKAYHTPLGEIPVDADALAWFQEQLDWDIFEGELAHLREHSVEFPALLLRYIYPEQPFRMVAVLSNFVFLDDPRIDRFVEALRSFLRSTKQRVVLLASVDFSHVGPMFGGKREVTEGDAHEIRRRDLKTLELLAGGQAEAFYWDVMGDGNARHIDALGACYVLLRALGPVEGKLVHYGQAYHPQNTVTFAGLILT
ncbi:MAG: AmmeMemoRadiSam system protein B [Calditrichaeota bacterium]|nr:MAG: AmmeMemoRadiSam system protein B [Calditrichota bacterium]